MLILLALFALLALLVWAGIMPLVVALWTGGTILAVVLVAWLAFFGFLLWAASR